MSEQKIKHHLTDQLLMGYAAGTLPEAFNLVVATHISLCDECRARLYEFEAVGGAVLDGLDGADAAEMSEGSLDATLKLISRRAKDPIKTMRASRGVFPKPLQDYVGGDADAVKWRRVGGGVKQAVLPTTKDASVRLLYIPAGMEVPDHGHHGTELTLVLQGAFIDDDGRFARGDVEVANEELEHTPVADIGEDCICLSATDAPLRFNRLIPRVAQRLMRI
ncbi:MAG: ChrR family anti-sigma-E factor [Pseudomonadota bacterium]